MNDLISEYQQYQEVKPCYTHNFPYPFLQCCPVILNLFLRPPSMMMTALTPRRKIRTRIKTWVAKTIAANCIFNETCICQFMERIAKTAFLNHILSPACMYFPFWYIYWESRYNSSINHVTSSRNREWWKSCFQKLSQTGHLTKGSLLVCHQFLFDSNIIPNYILAWSRIIYIHKSQFKAMFTGAFLLYVFLKVSVNKPKFHLL